ncbi:hypothetical protein DPMN_061416 [Dreissena polymorpha]|uniref:Uncharacterized protein n=1 Tax=Dreissena polymorpha TaxID=45954 RepID=A0A9D4HGX0_DREPO|nr:hypothetical protein DPMN_061416 [Dreissena polymorpha]
MKAVFAILFVALVSLKFADLIDAAPTPMDDEDRQEIANLAARIIKVAISNTGYYASEKRNAGTVDSLYNLPHLLSVGKK